MEGQTDGQRGGIWRARKLIIQLVCWVARGEEVMRATKGRPPPIPSPSTVSCCALMSALFRQHVCFRHAPATNPLFTPHPPSFPSIHSSLYTLHLCCAYKQAPCCWREPQVNKKIGEGRVVEGRWVVGGGCEGGSRWCNRCASSSSSAVQADRELWVRCLCSAPITFPLLCPGSLSSPLSHFLLRSALGGRFDSTLVLIKMAHLF